MLAVVAFSIGTLKIIRPSDSLRRHFFWLEDLTPEMVRGVGYAEFLLGVALFVSPVFGLSYWLSASVAAGYAALMVVIAALHSSNARGPLVVAPRGALVALSLAVVAGLL